MLIDVRGRPITSSKRQIRVTDHRLFEYLSWGDPLLPNHALTICCQKCGGSLSGRNHDHDSVWTLECGCTQWVWRRAADEAR